MDLHQTRGASQIGPLPITFAEIEARSRLMREAMRPWEVRAIRALDEAWLAEGDGASTVTDKTT